MTSGDNLFFVLKEHLLSVPEQSLADSIFSLEEAKRFKYFEPEHAVDLTLKKVSI